MPAKRRAPASAFLSSPKKAKCESYSPSPSTLDPCVLQLPALAATNPFTNSFRSIDQHQHQHDIHNNDDHQFKHNKGFIPITIETFALVNISLVQQFNNNNLDIILAGDRARPPSSLVVTPTTTTSSSSSSTPLDPTFHLLQQQNAISIATPLHHHNPKMIESHKKIAPQIVSMRELQIHPTHVNIDERMSHDIIPSPTSATSSSHPTFDNNPYFHPFVPSSPTFDMTHVVINNNYLSGHSFMINTPSLHYSSMTCTLKPLQYRTRAHGTRVIRTGTNSHNHGQPYAYRKRTHTRVIRTNSGLTGEWDHDHNHNSTKPTTIFREIINKSLLVIGQIATAVGYIMTDNIDTDTDTDTD